MLSIPLDERTITDEEIFAAFNLEYPGLENVKEALKHKNFPEAKKQLIHYMERRSRPCFLYDYRTLPLVPIDTDSCPYSFQSSLGLKGSLKEFCLYVAQKLITEHVYVLPGLDRREVHLGKNWESMIHFNFHTDIGKIHRSYLDMMVRGQFFESLCVLYHETGDSSVLTFFEEILQVFFRTYPLVITHPAPSTDRFQYTEDRDVMSVGWLSMVYISLFYTRVPYEISAELSFEILKRIWFLGIQFRRFDTDTYRPYNHHMWERGLVPFILGTMFPEIPDFAAMKQRGAEIINRHIKEDFNSSGGYSEHSIAYWSGASIGEMLYRGICLASLNQESLMDEETALRMKATFHALAMLCPPGKCYPSLGDNGSPMSESILELGVKTMDHKECKQILKIRKNSSKKANTCGLEYDSSNHPLPLDFCNDQAGFLCSKSGYDFNSNYLLMSAKINCGYSGHNHMDMLSLFLSIRGEDIIGEPYAGLLYHNVRMNSELRGYMYNMTSHNTVLAYGQPIAPNAMYANKWGVYRTPSPVTTFHTETNGIYASAYHDGYTFCRHTRELLFHRNRGLIVSDHLMRGNRLDSPHIQRWNLMPDVSVTVAGSSCVIVEKHGVRLLFVWSGAKHTICITQADLLVPEIFPGKEYLAPVLDISFQSLETQKSQNVTVTLNLLILDITDQSIDIGNSDKNTNYCTFSICECQIENLQTQLDILCQDLGNSDALKNFPSL